MFPGTVQAAHDAEDGEVAAGQVLEVARVEFSGHFPKGPLAVASFDENQVSVCDGDSAAAGYAGIGGVRAAHLR